MKLGLALGFVCAAKVASAGGLLLPGAGAVSTSRAGAATVSSEEGEALTLNPANIAAVSGTVITFGIAAIDYYMSFQRNGAYDPIMEESVSYAGQRYPTISNDAKPPLGIGGFQPVPVVAISSDLGNRVPGLHVAFGLYAPNAYPFRDMNNVNGKPYFIPNDKGGYDFPVFGAPPPPTRYDIIHEEGAIILPSLGVAYRVNKMIDVGARFTAGFGTVKSTVAVWGLPGNYEEWNKADGLFSLTATDKFIPEFSLGTTLHPTDNLDFAARYTSELDVNASGDAISNNGPNVSLSGNPIMIAPVDDSIARCAKGGTMDKLKGCVDLALPQTATVGGRYKFLDDNGKLKGDIELDFDWENWGADSVSNYRVVVDAQVEPVATPGQGIQLQDQEIRHGLRNTYAARLGGSWVFPTGANAWVARGGISYDTAAAKTGWERADLDGAARTMIAAGGSYKMPKVSIDFGFGVILEGTRTDSRTCNPTASKQGCGPMGDQPLDQRQGPDPIVPIFPSNVQAENPVNEGTYKSHYLLFMLGTSYKF